MWRRSLISRCGIRDPPIHAICDHCIPQIAELEERWQSGRMRRIANPLYWSRPVPRVRIPPSPPFYEARRARQGAPSERLCERVVGLTAANCRGSYAQQYRPALVLSLVKRPVGRDPRHSSAVCYESVLTQSNEARVRYCGASWH